MKCACSVELSNWERILERSKLQTHQIKKWLITHFLKTPSYKKGSQLICQII